MSDPGLLRIDLDLVDGVTPTVRRRMEQQQQVERARLVYFARMSDELERLNLLLEQAFEQEDTRRVYAISSLIDKVAADQQASRNAALWQRRLDDDPGLKAELLADPWADSFLVAGHIPLPSPSPTADA